MSILKILITLCILITCSFVIAQSDTSKSQNNYSYKLTTDEVKGFYHKTFYNEFEYLNGKEYKPYHHPSHSNPYFNSKMGIGTLYIDGNIYTDLLFIYDIHNDELIHIAKNVNLTQYYINLKKEEIDSFTITHENTTIMLHNIQFNKELGTTLSNGFYEITKFKNMSLYYKHTAVLTHKLGYDEYIYLPTKYLSINNNYYPIKSKRQFISHFPENKKEFKKEISTISKPFRQFSKGQLIQVFQFIESLQGN
jgi:hypothetical protein